MAQKHHPLLEEHVRCDIRGKITNTRPRGLLGGNARTHAARPEWRRRTLQYSTVRAHLEQKAHVCAAPEERVGAIQTYLSAEACSGVNVSLLAHTPMFACFSLGTPGACANTAKKRIVSIVCRVLTTSYSKQLGRDMQQNDTPTKRRSGTASAQTNSCHHTPGDSWRIAPPLPQPSRGICADKRWRPHPADSVRPMKIW